MDLLEIQKKSYALLDRKGRRKYILATAIHTSLGLLDIVGITLAGAIGILASSSLTGTQISPPLEKVLGWVSLDQKSFNSLILILSITTFFFFAAIVPHRLLYC